MSNTAEEKRLREIDEIACLYDPATVEAAKYGPDACTAQEMAYRAALRAAQADEVKALVKDLLNGQSKNDPQMADARAAVKALLHGQD